MRNLFAEIGARETAALTRLTPPSRVRLRSLASKVAGSMALVKITWAMPTGKFRMPPETPSIADTAGRSDARIQDVEAVPPPTLPYTSVTPPALTVSTY